MPGGKIFVLDNYDSFTFNLVRYCAELGAEVIVRRPDQVDAREAVSSGADAILISPGPGAPGDAVRSLELVRACAEMQKPLLGICLGHQVIASAFGVPVKRADLTMHGKTSPVMHDGTGLFERIPSPLTVMRYHSLVVDEPGPSSALTVNARADDGSIQGLKHRALPIHGVQFHPESVASQFGHDLIGNFLAKIR